MALFLTCFLFFVKTILAPLLVGVILIFVKRWIDRD